VDLFRKCRDFKDVEQVKALGLYAYFREISSQQDPEVVMQGRRVVMLGSNNYLGLTSHPLVKERAAAAAMKYGSGCAGSRFLNGTLDIHVELEEKLAAFVRKEAALVFSTGFQTNLGVISTVAGKGDMIYIDKANHASIIDGCRLSFARVRKFNHLDLDDLERLLKEDGEAPGKLVVVDGVFSMEGDIFPVDRLVGLAGRYGARVMVDDAHGLGVLGESGRGTAIHFGVNDRVDLVMGTFSKSLASVGGFIAGPAEVVNWIKHTSRPLIFSAAPPPASVAAVIAALEIIEREPERLERLWANTRILMDGLRGMGFDLGDTATPIIPVIVGDDMLAFKMVLRLQELGVFANPVVSPATPPGRALIRNSLMATHEASHLERALEAFRAAGKEFGLIR
jgi:8-amino-7-oxononanoate synthase